MKMYLEVHWLLFIVKKSVFQYQYWGFWSLYYLMFSWNNILWYRCDWSACSAQQHEFRVQVSVCQWRCLMLLVKTTWSKLKKGSVIFSFSVIYIKQIHCHYNPQSDHCCLSQWMKECKHDYLRYWLHGNSLLFSHKTRQTFPSLLYIT